MGRWCPHDDIPEACPVCHREKVIARGGQVGGRSRAKMTSSSAQRGSRTFARFKSQCPLCMGLIRLDSAIIMSSDGWAHEGCMT